MKPDPSSVAYIGPFPPIQGGISQHGHQLLVALRHLGVTTKVISWHSQYPRLLYPGSQVRVDARDGTHFLRWWWPTSWLKARRNIRNVDIVVTPYVSPIHAIPMRVILGGARGQRVAIVHNALPHERLPFSQAGLRLTLSRIDRIVTHSHIVAGQVRSIYPGLDTAVVPLPPILPIEAHPLPTGPAQALFFGYLRPYKGVDLLIDTVAELRSSGTSLPVTVAGEVWGDANALVRRAEEKGVSDLIDFQFSYLPDERVEDLLARHHLVIQPYLHASQSGVIPMAFAAGRGVVVTPVGGLREMVEDGVNGYVASAVEPGALASAISIALRNLERISSGAIRSVPDWADVASAILGIDTPRQRPTES